MAGLEGMMLGSCRILRHIGSGGMGDIYLADQPDLGRQVAIKVIHGEANLVVNREAQKKALQQFVREARAIAALEHPNILPIYDFGEQNGTLYLVMQYVPFGSLADFITLTQSQRYKLPLNPTLAADLIDQAAGALQFAHDRQIVHLDVKPQNLLVRVLPVLTARNPSFYQQNNARAYEAFSNEPPLQTPGEIPVQIHILLADFGLARFVTWISGHSGTTGTPLYTSPEQYNGNASPASDQYALAVVAYLLLTGQPVFSGTLAELHHQHLTAVPTPATNVNPLLPPGVNGVFARALAKDPAQRFGRIHDFAQALHFAINPAHQTDKELLLPTLPISIMEKLAAPPFLPPASGAIQTPFPGQSTPAAGSGAWGAPSAMGTGQTSLPPGTWTSQPRPSSGGQNAFWNTPSQSGARLSAPPPSVTPAGNWRVNPDKPRAPLPGSGKKSLRQRLAPSNLSFRQRLLFGGLALIIILGSLSAILFGVVLRAHTPPTAAANQLHFQVQKVKGLGRHNLANVPSISSNTPVTQDTLPARLRGSGEDAASVASAAAALQQLPALSPDQGATVKSISAGGSSGPAAAQAVSGGLGQQQVGIHSPMDISVASANQYLFEAVDGTLLIVGPHGNRVVSLASFLAPILSSGDVLGEPRLLYDAAGDRWILVVNQLHITNGAVTEGRLDVAITSTSSDPTGDWYFYQFNTQIPTYSAQCNWADYPQIGIDVTSIFITGTSFACGPNGAFLGADLWEFPRQEFLHGATNPVSSWTGFTNAQGHPVVTLTPTVENDAITTEWLLADDAGYADFGQVSNRLSLWALSDTPSPNKGGAPSAASIAAGAVTLPFPYADPPSAEQKGTSTKLAIGDARITQAQLSQGHLFAAFTTAVNWVGSSTTNAGIYWVDLVPSLHSSGNATLTTGASAKVAQQNIFGLPGGYVFYSSLVIDLQRNVVLLAELSSADRYPGLVFASRSQSSPANTLGQGNTAILLNAGTAPSTAAHWGDYTGGSLAFSPDGKQAGISMAGVYPDSNASAWQTSLWKFNLTA